MLLPIVVLGAMIFTQCASAAPSKDTGTAVFNDVKGKEWALLEVRTPGKTITINRRQLEDYHLSGAYTISFREGMVGGMGAPNRCTAPYTEGPGNSLNIGNIASTMMLAFREPDDLREHEFFAYLSAVDRWNLRNEKLELHSKDSGGNEAILVFEIR